jgi:molecular chaperone Hsp33
MADCDSLQRFVLEGYAIRGEIAHLDDTWQRVLARRNYPPVIQRLLGEAMAAALLLSATIKFQGQLTLQLQGQGALKLLLVQCTSDRQLRGLARWEDPVADAPLSSLCDRGTLAITLDLGPRHAPYQGIVPLTGDSFAATLETYFYRSEQLPTRLYLVADQSRSAGLLLQQLPSDLENDTWQRIQGLSATLNDTELLSWDGPMLISRLFPEDDIRLFAAQPVSFHCTCSRERISALLRALGRDEVREIHTEQGNVTVTCEFCGMPYSFDAVDSESVFVTPTQPSSSDTQH